MTLSQGLSSIFSRWPFLVICGVLGILAGNYLVGGAIDKYQVRAEVLIVPSYEYTAPSVRQSTPTQLTRIDLDELVNNEIQIMSSIPSIAGAARVAPPVFKGRSTPTPSELLQMVAIRRVENTSVIDLQIIDQNTDWAIAFTDALIEAYKSERAKIFADPGVERSITLMIDTVSSEIDQTLAELSEIEDKLFSFVANLKNAIAFTPGARIALTDSTEDQLRLAAVAARIGTKLGLPSGWEIAGSTIPLIGQTSGQQVEDLDSQNLENVLLRIASASSLLQTHDALLERLNARTQTLQELEEIQRQNTLRLNSNAGIHVLTPPVASERPVGLSNLESQAAMALLGVLVGVLLLIGFEALWTRQRRGDVTS